MPTNINYLAATPFLDFNAAAVQAFIKRILPPNARDKRAQAIALYYGVRDQIRYDVYDAAMDAEGLRASSVVNAASGMCIHKSLLYCATLRAIGVPARLWFADVRNHLSSPRLREYVGGDVFHFHCLVELCLDGENWLKTTPVFNKQLCLLYKMMPLEFDGYRDSMHHPFDELGNKYMEFVKHHGSFADLPFDWLDAGLRELHPKMFNAEGKRYRQNSLIKDAVNH
ncbi:transglutaminase-like domain-containing protein [Serratia fonticola]|uniref:transglutaminase-like domain-containing protein n=1 Tax=Serratia fonticola TaxID=47917 RepID=UPI002DB73216|nr:transglutaminase family protein [Serratia fonticola]MEB7884968.1 transglutaminase family protein [Serratia fonticola]